MPALDRASAYTTGSGYGLAREPCLSNNPGGEPYHGMKLEKLSVRLQRTLQVALRALNLILRGPLRIVNQIACGDPSFSVASR